MAMISVSGRSSSAVLFRQCVSLRRSTTSRRRPITLPLSSRPSKHNHIIILNHYNNNNSLKTKRKLTTAATLEDDRNSASSSSAAAVAPPPPPPPPEAAAEGSSIREWARMLDIRVGRIVRAWKHEEADSLYVEEVDIGETSEEDDGDGDGPQKSLRLICSGLVKYIPLHILQDKKVVVLANLKPRNMRGVKSYGMLMAASDSSHENVELLEPPENSLPGDRIWFGDLNENENLPDAASPNQIQKKKIWEMVQPHLKTNASCVAVLGDDVMQTSAGVVRSKSLKDANIA